jgi:hypothetical protein
MSSGFFQDVPWMRSIKGKGSGAPESRGSSADGVKTEGVHPGSKEVDIAPQDVRSFPTWSGAGVTNVRVTNQGSKAGLVEFYAGAGYENQWLAPAGQSGDVRLVSRQWAGLQVYVKNGSNEPDGQVHVEVW